MNTLAYMIERSAEYNSERTAFICDGEHLSFREANKQANAFARGLSQLNVNKGDRVAVLLPNCSEFAIVDFALIKGGLVRVPLNSRLAIPEMEYILKDSQASVLVYGFEYKMEVEKLKEKVNLSQYICVGDKALLSGDLSYETIIEKTENSSFAKPVTDEDLFQIAYTSGTTGRPKGAVTSVRSRISSLNNVFIDELQITPNDAMLHVASLSHGGGTKVLPHFVKGAANIFMKKFTIGEFLDQVEKYKVTTTWLVPTMVSMIVEHPNLQDYDYSSLKTIVYAAAPMPVATLKKAMDIFGNVFVQVYGLTEAPNPDLVLTKTDHLVGLYERPAILASAGREVMNVRMRIIDEKGNDVPVGEMGEIIIAGENIMTEYWKLPEATKETIRDGWIYTGDIARKDEDGYIYIVDRRKDMIISGGFNVYPREIEEVLYQHPSILEAAVIGIPDERWGESVKGFVVTREGFQTSEKEVIEYCHKYLAGYKKPKSIEFLSELPKSSNGKILKKVLRDNYWQGRERQVN
jgi:long-chain acyl-CoA synthetase